MPDLPLSVREGADPSRFVELQEGVPEWLFGSLAEWLRRYFGRRQRPDAVVRELELGLHLTIPEFDRSSYVMGDSYRFEGVMLWCRREPVRLLAVVNWTCSTLTGCTLLTGTVPRSWTRSMRHLAQTLHNGGSA